MHLSYREIEAIDKKRSNIEKNFPDDLRPCNKCEGTGLDNITKYKDGGYGWDGYTYCDLCKGLGYLDWKETVFKKLCPSCQGKGKLPKSRESCFGCEGTGIVDWVKYMRLGGKHVDKKDDKKGS